MLSARVDRGRFASVGLALVLTFLVSSPSQAQWVVAGEAGAAVPLDGWASEAYGAGGTLSATAFRTLGDWFFVGARLRAGLLSDGDPPNLVGVEDPGLGSLVLVGASVRFRIPGLGGDNLAVGPYLEGTAGLGVSGADGRPGLEAGIGWTFEVGPVALGPSVHYLQFIQPDGADNVVGPDDARLLLFGIEVGFHVTPAEPSPEPVIDEGPGDRDGDGIVDDFDQCPDDPEDFDQFQDSDGCPDEDNDEDQILDIDDQCPNTPEDFDQFEDTDGCPEPDNDGDGVLDQDDRCPTELEVINGLDDNDGCPDEGLIEMVDDRIILEERVLFDTDRWVVKPRAYPVLSAIVELWRQHPEWARVAVEGHADYRGRDDYNQQLSQRRAQAVKDVLVELGMPDALISAVGFGASRPRVVGFGTRAMARNRRVEFVVLDNGTGVPLGASGQEEGAATEGTAATTEEAQP